MATQKEIAEHLDIGERHVRTLLKDSVIPKAKYNHGLSFDDCRKAYINFLRNNANSKPSSSDIGSDESGSIDIESERAGLIQQQRINQTLKNDVLDGRSVPVEIVSDVLGRVLAQVASTLSAIPLNVKRKFPNIDKRAIDQIHREIVSKQNEATKLDEYIERAIDDAIDAAESKV